MMHHADQYVLTKRCCPFRPWELGTSSTAVDASRAEDIRTARKRKLRELKEDLEDGDITQATYNPLDRTGLQGCVAVICKLSERL